MPYLPTEMDHRISLNIQQVVQRIHTRPTPQYIYHYTNGPGFIGIVESKSLWATHIAFTNDSQEYFGASELIRLKIDELVKCGSLSESQARILFAVKNNLGFSVNDMYHCFVACFSERKDDLAQWRGYSGKEGKYKVAFDVRHLAGLIAEFNKTRGILSKQFQYQCYLTPVIYSQTDKETLLVDMLNFVISQYPIDEATSQPTDKNAFAKTWAESYVEAASTLAPLVKDDGFSQESEWRLVAVPPTNKNVKYRNRGTLLTPYLEIDLQSDKKLNMDWDYPLREIWIGPSAHMNLNEAAAKHLLERERIRSLLFKSSIPYRDI